MNASVGAARPRRRRASGISGGWYRRGSGRRRRPGAEQRGNGARPPQLFVKPACHPLNDPRVARANALGEWFAQSVLSLAVSVLAFAVAVWAAITARSQLRLQQDTAGGSGILFAVQRVPWAIFHNDVEHMKFNVIVELFGPAVRYQVALHLERDGRQLEADDPCFRELLSSRKTMSCTDQAIEWEFEQPASAIADLWCICSWVEPREQTIWTRAYAINLAQRDDIYEWRWYRMRELRRRLQERKRRYRPLGKWRLHTDLTPQVGNGPFDLGTPPAEFSEDVSG